MFWIGFCLQSITWIFIFLVDYPYRISSLVCEKHKMNNYSNDSWLFIFYIYNCILQRYFFSCKSEKKKKTGFIWMSFLQLGCSFWWAFDFTRPDEISGEICWENIYYDKTAVQALLSWLGRLLLGIISKGRQWLLSADWS